MFNGMPRLLRSVLYVPGSSAKALAKAAGLGADALILDLEDSVAPEAKAMARGQVVEFLSSHANRKFLCTVRINGLQTAAWRDDVQALLPARPDALVIPKVDHYQSLSELASFIAQATGRMEDDFPLPLWPMIESPLGVIHAFAIASHHRVSCLVLGTSDLTKALRLRAGMGRESLGFALQQTILAARAAGVAVIDGVYLDLRNPEGFAAQCREGAALGFDGKTVIHPDQIAPANRAFLPSAEEVEWAQRILAQWQEARTKGEEICLVDGRLVERLHAEEAQRLLDQWKSCLT